MSSALLFAALAAHGAETFEGMTWYFGDPHFHTAYSDGTSSDMGVGCRPSTSCGAYAEIVDTAAANGLDWFAITDHVTGAPEMVIEASEFAVELADFSPLYGPTDVVGIVGAEVETRQDLVSLGHKNVYFFGTEAELKDLVLADTQPRHTITQDVNCEELDGWMQDLYERFGPVLLVPHHPYMTRPAFTDWSCHQARWEVAVEIYSQWGTSLGWDREYDPMTDPEAVGSSVYDALDPDQHGLQMAFLGGTDNHFTYPGNRCNKAGLIMASAGGRTIVAVPEGRVFDRRAIYDAIVARQTLASSGPNLPMSLSWSVEGVAMASLGEDLSLFSHETLTVQVRFPDAYAGSIRQVYLEALDQEWILEESDAGAWNVDLDGHDVPPWAFVAVEIDGAAFWGDDFCNDLGTDDIDWVWSSPSWFDVTETDADEDGYLEMGWGDDCNDTRADVHPGGVEVWYDGYDQDCAGDDDFDADKDACPVPADCDDTLPTVHPGMAETWYDGLDQDCAGDDDFDADRDGHPIPDDCNDADTAIHPGAPGIWYDGVDHACTGDDFDADGDGSPIPDDCDDTAPSVYPGAAETWYDGVDQDCAFDDDFDADKDGVELHEDCRDTNASVHPGATETWYDGVDQDCGGDSDFDADADGSSFQFDCDDFDPTSYPGAAEIWYDGVDQDCDGPDDYDFDGDGYDHWWWGGGDCADWIPWVHPGARDRWYDGIDANCDGHDDYDADGDGLRSRWYGGSDCDDRNPRIRDCHKHSPWHD